MTKEIRINPATGIFEEHEQPGLFGSIVEGVLAQNWSRSTDAAGLEHRVNPDTGILETHEPPGLGGSLLEAAFGENWNAAQFDDPDEADEEALDY
jgi:hypothetical protein